MVFQQKIKFFLLRKVTKFIIYSILKTCKIKIIGNEHIEELNKKKIPIIYVIWHRHIFFVLYKFKNKGVRPLISLSQDGEIIYQIAVEFGFNPIRGSSSKGGARAFLELLNSIEKENSEILITADGPRGPVKEIKDGIIILAQKTGSVIVPISWYSSRVKIFKKTWDQFIVPFPFSEITFVFCKPFSIKKDVDIKNLSLLKNELRQIMNNSEKYVENIYKKNK